MAAAWIARVSRQHDTIVARLGSRRVIEGEREEGRIMKVLLRMVIMIKLRET